MKDIAKYMADIIELEQRYKDLFGKEEFKEMHNRSFESSLSYKEFIKADMETSIKVINKLVEMYEDVCNSELMEVEEPKPTCYCSGRIAELKCTDKCKHYYNCEMNRQYRTMQEYDFNARKEINSIKCFGKYNKECLSNTCILYNLCKKQQRGRDSEQKNN